ncbi:MAG: sporulation integral membrane protein YtvI [Tepidanaerobacteraceae bacterium]|nr:sporulation integral membrane protein YtvI [Thermoanaerobacterales bacterium]
MKIKGDYKPILLLALAIICTSIVIVLALRYLLPLVIGIILALIIEPTVSFLERKTDYDRGVITAIVLTAICCIFGYISILMIARFTFELGRLLKFLPTQIVYYESLLNEAYLFFVDFFAIVPKDVLIYLKANFGQIFSSLIGYISNYYSLLVSRIGMLPNLFINILVLLIFVFLFCYFFTKDKDKIVESIKCLFPDQLQEKVKSIQLELFFSFIRLIKAQLILVFFSTVITVTGFYILKVDYALTLGIICGLLDIMPLVGPSIIFIPWIIYSIIIGNTYFSIGLLILFVIILGSRQLLQAKVIGKNLGIDPLLTLVSIYLGITIFGWKGLFIGPLVIVIVRALTHSGIIPPLRKV